jgi:RNase P subunit RPR2
MTARVCHSCGAPLIRPVLVKARHRRSEERRVLCLCRKCAAAPMAVWRLRWEPVEVEVER